MSLEAAKNGLIEVLSQFLKSEQAFMHVPHWEKRA
jgi:hypothetical protein